MKKRSFVKDERGIAAATIVAITFICVTFVAWTLTWTPLALMTDAFSAMSNDPRALLFFDSAHNVVGWILIIEIAAYVVWWLISAFRKEDQTYPRGYR